MNSHVYNLYYFYGSKKILPDEFQYGDVTMYRSAKDALTDRTMLRDDTYSQILEILWSPDMNFAIVIDGSTTNNLSTGAITLLTTDNKSPLVLVPEGRKPRWGVNR